MLDASYYEKADEIIAQYSCEERSLIPIIQGIQEEYRYLPPELLTYVAGKLGISEAKAYSVATISMRIFHLVCAVKCMTIFKEVFG